MSNAHACGDVMPLPLAEGVGARRYGFLNRGRHRLINLIAVAKSGEGGESRGIHLRDPFSVALGEVYLTRHCRGIGGAAFSGGAVAVGGGSAGPLPRRRRRLQKIEKLGGCGI